MSNKEEASKIGNFIYEKSKVALFEEGSKGKGNRNKTESIRGAAKKYLKASLKNIIRGLN